jgi:hypothetical protein
LKLDQLQRDGRIKRHLHHDVAVVYLGNLRSKTNQFDCVNGAVFSVSGSIFQCDYSNNCTLFTNVPNGYEIVILGYPVELLKPALQWLTSALESQVDFEYPLIRRGIISQKNHKTQKFVIDSGVYGGNSGGPVFILQHPSMDTTEFRIVGIVTEFVPTETRVNPRFGVTNSILVNSGYGVVEPIDFAIELMDQF